MNCALNTLRDGKMLFQLSDLEKTSLPRLVEINQHLAKFPRVDPKILELL